MDFDFDSDEKAFFKQLSALLKELDRDLEAQVLDVAEKNLRDALAMLAKTPFPELSAGAGSGPLGMTTLMSAMELMGHASPSLQLGVGASAGLFGRALAAFGTAQQKERWLGPITEGRMVGALALSEAAMNIVNDPLMTRGEQLDGQVADSGQKAFVINAPLADICAIVGLLEDRPVLFLLKKSAEGLSITERLSTSGFTGAAISGLTLESCAVSDDDVLRAGKATDLLATLRSWEDLILIGASLGLMKTGLENAKKHSKTHKTAKGKPIVAFQEVSFKLAEMLTLYQTSQLLALRAAWASQSGASDAETLIRCAKVFCAESAEELSSAALQILSTTGIVTPNPVEDAFRCSKLVQIVGTSTEIARVQIGDDTLERWG